MSNQSFDANGNTSASNSDSSEGPIPIAQQLSQKSYLSNIQHKMDALLEASGAEAEDESISSVIPSTAGRSTSAYSSRSSAPERVNKMDSFFAQAAAEEEAAAEELAAKLAAAAESPSVSTNDQSEPLPTDVPQQDVTNIQAESLDAPNEAPVEVYYETPAEVHYETPAEVHYEAPAETAYETPAETAYETMPEAQPEEVPPSEPRPTGYAGLTAGLAAAGLGSLGARMAEESTPTPEVEFASEEAQPSVEPPSMPCAPIIPVVDPSFSAHNFDLEAARLEDVAGPVFSQEFDEKEPSPQERLANRLQRENLVPQENQLCDQSSASQSPSLDSPPSFQGTPLDQGTSDGYEALAPASTQEPESSLGDSEPIADLFVEIPQVSLPPEFDQVSVDLQNNQPQPLESMEETHSSPIEEPATENTQLQHPSTVPEENSPGAFPSVPPQMMVPSPLPPLMPTSEASVDPRLLEATRLEDEFKQLHQQEESYVEQAQQEQLEHELATAENATVGELEERQEQVAETPEEDLPAVEDKSAAIQQAERVKEAREKASQVAQNPEPVVSPTEPSFAQEEVKPTPQLLVPPDDVQFANQPVLIPPGSVQPEVPSSAPQPTTNDRRRANRPVAEHKFQFDLFYTCMLEHLSDGVIFVDHKQRVKMWSRGAEKATGIIPGVVLDRILLPQTINLCDTDGNGLQLDKCPVAKSLRTLEIVAGEYKITNSTNPRGMKVELTVIPVIDKNRYVNGAVVMFHDRTAQVNLQRQLKDLYEFSVLDPLTQVANRAEFERVQQEYVLAFQQSDDFNCSIIICDIDYFKSINDNFGHTVGDEALMSFAEMLKRYVRPQDLVARYGGEEFVILCADCDTAAAVQRAEEIRMALYKTPQPMLDGKSISASFGVSELREGDTATDFFVRADTALLKAKETGRNRVVAGDGSTPSGSDETATELSVTGIRWKAQQRKKTSLICEEFQTETPIQVLVEKLRGFIVENNAVLQRVEPEFLSMEIEVEAPMDYSRKGAFTMNVEFKETEASASGASRTKTLNYIRVTIYAGKVRNWFSTNHTDLAPHLLSELRRFLMIGDKASRLSVDMATSNVR